MSGRERIISMTNKGALFYPTMGPRLSNREIVRELGYPVWDDPGKTWFVALDGRILLGFCALLPSVPVRFTSDYVLPAYRRRGIYSRLFAARMETAAELPCRASATQASLPMFERHGFTNRGHAGGISICSGRSRR